MDKPIGVGDLVMMVRGHECLFQRSAGVPFTVRKIVAPMGGGWTCNYCNLRNAGPNVPAATGIKVIDTQGRWNVAGIPVSWLIRIDSTELETEHTEDEVTA
jgi:hypothetical protein